MFPDWWQTIAEGEPRVFGMLQLDVAGHSQLQDSSHNIQKTKAHLKKHVSAILSIYDAALLNWAGDGGAYLFLPQANDDMVTGALHILHDMSFFNGSDKNCLDKSLNIRVSCHRGECIFSKDSSTMHGQALNYFLKYEREIGLENTVVLTENVYHELNSEGLKGRFEEKGEHVWTLGNKKYTDSLYASASPNYERIFDENRTRIETLKEQLIGKSIQACHVAIGELAEIGTPQAITALVDALPIEHQQTNNIALKTLVRFGKSAVPALIQALGYQLATSRSEAILILGEIGEPAKDAVPALIEALGDENQVRSNATKVLGRIGEPAVPALIEALGDKNHYVRDNAVSALTKIATPDALKALKEYEQP